MKKRIVLCADDYGQAQPISEGILALVKMNRLSAVSCMVTKPDWRDQAEWLAPHASEIDVGLHFNLTEDKSPLPLLMLRASLRQLKTSAIAAELHRQLDAFTGAFGFSPKFIDGHQHVHQFPVVRQALIEVYRDRLLDERPYVRVINSKIIPGDLICNIKKFITRNMGSRPLARLLDQHAIPHNHSFSGMYAFSKASDYPGIFNRFLDEIANQGIIMCHPGLPSPPSNDPIATARAHEYHYFTSPRFPADCAAVGVEIVRWE